MIIKEKSLYRKLLDWHKKTFGYGFWDGGDDGEGSLSTGTGIIVFLIILLAWYFDSIWQPIFYGIINDIMTYFS